MTSAYYAALFFASAIVGLACLSEIGKLPESRIKNGDLPIRLVVGFVGSVASVLYCLIMYVKLRDLPVP